VGAAQDKQDNQKRKLGLGCRTEARRRIGTGRVTANGEKIQTPDVWIDPEHDRVALDGRPLTARKKIYLLLHKPKGYLTTCKDPRGRPKAIGTATVCTFRQVLGIVNVRYQGGLALQDTTYATTSRCFFHAGTLLRLPIWA
jgi:hypothetical protein